MADFGPLVPLEKAIYSRMNSDSDLVTNLGSQAIYNTVASQRHPDDYVVFTLTADEDQDDSVSTQGSRIRDFLFTVKCVSYNRSKASLISDILDSLFHFNFLTVSEWNNFWIARESNVNFIETDPANRIIHHVGFVMRIRLEKEN